MRRVLSAAVVVATLVVAPTALGWSWPTDGPVLRPFSVGPDPYAGGQHRGIDIGVPAGTEVRAPAGGSVSFAGTLPQGGRAVTIQTADGYSVTLLQLAETVVARGAVVAEGDVVGRSGPSADPATVEPHVHLGVRLTVDPDGYVDPLGLLPTPASAPVAVPAPAPEPVHASGEAAPAGLSRHPPLLRNRRPPGQSHRSAERARIASWLPLLRRPSGLRRGRRDRSA